jgi:hypothetical protein
MIVQSPLEKLMYPRCCTYPGCEEISLFKNAVELDEHITEQHLSEAVWNFAVEHSELSR